MMRIARLLLLLVNCASGLRVLVTGAGGRTGALVFETLKKEYDSITPMGLVRSKKAQKKLRKVGAAAEDILVGDVTNEQDVARAMQGCDAVVLCTSAVPRIQPWSIAKLLFKKQILRRKDAGRPTFSFGAGGTPQEVDWLGAKRQIDAASSAGVRHFVFIGSMGGTQPENFLNSIGRRADGTGGDILLWKRKAERHLVASGMEYTIVHPGGLIDQPPAERELIVDVDDRLLGGAARQVSRADVARVACAAVAHRDKARNKSFDLASRPVGEGTPTAEPHRLFDVLGARSCEYADQPDPPSLPSL